MLKVPQQQYIRFLREIEGANITEIAETIGIDWRTAKKYADKDDWNLPTTRKQYKMPVIDPYKELIDTILLVVSRIFRTFLRISPSNFRLIIRHRADRQPDFRLLVGSY